MRIVVITRVPPVEEDGNMCSPIVYRLPDSIMAAVLLHGRTPVFTLGEILFLDESGREANGLQRKPSKWDVDVEEFDTIIQALDRAIEVTHK